MVVYNFTITQITKLTAKNCQTPESLPCGVWSLSLQIVSQCSVQLMSWCCTGLPGAQGECLYRLYSLLSSAGECTAWHMCLAGPTNPTTRPLLQYSRYPAHDKRTRCSRRMHRLLLTAIMLSGIFRRELAMIWVILRGHFVQCPARLSLSSCIWKSWFYIEMMNGWLRLIVKSGESAWAEIPTTGVVWLWQL